MGASFHFDNSLHPSNHSLILKLDTRRLGKSEKTVCGIVRNSKCWVYIWILQSQCTTPISNFIISNLSNYLRLHVCLSFRLYLRSLHFRILSCITKWSFLKILKFNGCNCNHCTISTMPLLYQIRESKLYTY